jgi:cytochrome c553
MTRSMQVVFAVTLGLLVASVTWAADASPSMLGNACAPCHGTDGMSPGAIPALSGKSADYIVQRMLEFKAAPAPSRHCPANRLPTSRNACSNSKPAPVKAR